MKHVYRRRHRFLSSYRYLREWKHFIDRSYSSPSPTHIKMKTLVRYALTKGAWIETGTYMGGTTQYLAKRFPLIISIEPSEIFHNYSKSRLGKKRNIKLLNGTSEDLFEDALVSIAPLGNVWLDGHFSDGGTFLGNKVSPVEEELAAVHRNLDKFQALVIFIDDVRLFPRSDKEETGYPKFQWVTDWCKKNGFKWQIQNDILIAEMIR